MSQGGQPQLCPLRVACRRGGGGVAVLGNAFCVADEKGGSERERSKEGEKKGKTQILAEILKMNKACKENLH